MKGYLCDPGAGWEDRATILIRDGKVEAIFPDEAPDISDLPVLDLQDHLILPGLVDMHVHFREPGGEYKETIASGSAAAVAGGFTSVACMPNTSPPLDNAAQISYVLKKARLADLARVYPVGAVTLGQQGENLADHEAMAEAGAVAFSDDGRPIMNSRLMADVLKKGSALGRPIIDHCEDLTLSAGGVVYEGATGRCLGVPMVSRAAESVQVARDLVLQRATGGTLHLAHLSTRESVELFCRAREAGQDVSAEVTPHPLLLTEEAVKVCAADAKMNPPLGDAEDRSALQDALVQGLLDIVATDHAPHHQEEKGRSLLEAPFGVVGLETSFALLYTFLVKKGLLTLEALVRAMSLHPARRLNIPGGTLSPGAPADLVVVDPQRNWSVDQRAFFSLGKNTPFQGWKLCGSPVMTMVNGDMKMFRGRVKGVSADFPPLAEMIKARPPGQDEE